MDAVRRMLWCMEDNFYGKSCGCYDLSYVEDSDADWVLCEDHAWWDSLTPDEIEFFGWFRLL